MNLEMGEYILLVMEFPLEKTAGVQEMTLLCIQEIPISTPILCDLATFE